MQENEKITMKRMPIIWLEGDSDKTQCFALVVFNVDGLQEEEKKSKYDHACASLMVQEDFDESGNFKQTLGFVYENLIYGNLPDNLKKAIMKVTPQVVDSSVVYSRKFLLAKDGTYKPVVMGPEGEMINE